VGKVFKVTAAGAPGKFRSFPRKIDKVGEKKGKYDFRTNQNQQSCRTHKTTALKRTKKQKLKMGLGGPLNEREREIGKKSILSSKKRPHLGDNHAEFGGNCRLKGGSKEIIKHNVKKGNVRLASNHKKARCSRRLQDGS